MNTMTPERLRKFTSRQTYGEPDGPPLRAALYDAADAWTEDQRIIAYAQNDIAKQAIVIHELRERLEAAEKALAEAEKCVPMNWLDPLLSGPGAVVHQSPGPEIEMLLWEIRARIAALASAGWRELRG